VPAIHDVLFRMIGDDKSARSTLEEVAAELKAFGAIEAEAKATLDASEVTARLDLLKAQLQELEATEHDVKVRADIARAIAELEVFRAEVDSLPDDKTIDVEMKRGVEMRRDR